MYHLEGFASSEYDVRNNDNEVCVYVKMNVSFTVDYRCAHNGTNDKTFEVVYKKLSHPNGFVRHAYGRSSSDWIVPYVDAPFFFVDAPYIEK